MSGGKSNYQCKECGFKSTKWMGKCSNCGSWNSLEEVVDKEKKERNDLSEKTVTPRPITRIHSKGRTRLSSKISELDRVLGGGIVAGSVTLLGGAPGIGKSTLILQVASLFSSNYGRVLYISGEESARQLKLRGERLNILTEDLLILAETEFVTIKEHLEKYIEKQEYQLIIIDSIQTIYDSRLDSSPGSVNQIKEISNQLIAIAKKTEIPVFLIGHVTKEGELAGPKVLEHLVDTVLRIEGDRNYTYRILRSVKNRYGSTNEIGVFAMNSEGMKVVKNPSRIFLQQKKRDISGSVIAPIIEGSRTILVEVQALVSSATFSTPQRITTGVSKKRVSILLAVLEKKAGFSFQERDVHINIIGGLKVKEPALDLAIITAIISSHRDYSLSSGLAVIGEVGLAGEIRAIGQLEKRIKELKKMGFNRVVIPDNEEQENFSESTEIRFKRVNNIKDVINYIFK